MHSFKQVADVLKNDKLAVIPTDTIYGIVASARSATAVEKVYAARGRDLDKPCIILIDDVKCISDFGCVVSEAAKKIMSTLWNQKVSLAEKKAALEKYGVDASDIRENAFSLVVGCSHDDFTYLHRGTGTLCFRVPFGDNEHSPCVRNLLRDIGPIIAPSANTQGVPTPRDLAEIKGVFGDSVDAYVEALHPLNANPSHVIDVRCVPLHILR